MALYRRWRLIDDPVIIALARLSGNVCEKWENRYGYDNELWPTDVLAYSRTSGNYYQVMHEPPCRKDTS